MACPTSSTAAMPTLAGPAATAIGKYGLRSHSLADLAEKAGLSQPRLEEELPRRG